MVVPHNNKKPRTKNVKIPLLDWMEFESKAQQNGGDVENFILPLPSSQLPNELSTPFLYGIQLERPIDKLIMEEAKSIHHENDKMIGTTGGDASGDDDDDDDDETPQILLVGEDSTSNNLSSDRPIFGRLVWKDDDSDSLVGAIGCTGEMIISSPMDELLQGMDLMMDMDDDDDDSSILDATPVPSDTPSTTMLCRGGFRFVVKSVVQSIPYPIVIVDELEDNDNGGDNDDDEAEADKEILSTAEEDEDDEDDDDDDEYLDDYDNMPAEELIQKIMGTVQKIISQNVEDASSKERTLLEQSILETDTTSSDPSNKVPLDMTTIEQYQAEEMAAVWEIFQSSLVDDIAPTQRRFVLSMMAAELASLDNPSRTKLLTITNSLQRLRYLAGKLDAEWGMQQARKLAIQITEKTDEDDKDLKVGLPTLPTWARTIHKGSRIEYYWNEEYDWVAGEVLEEPTIQGGAFDELEVMMITIRFDDGEIHTLPLSGEDKARFRPPE